jgi:hypothetical protein
MLSNSREPPYSGAILDLATLAGFIGSLRAQNFGLAKVDPSATSQKALFTSELRLVDESGRIRLLLTFVREKPCLFFWTILEITGWRRG